MKIKLNKKFTTASSILALVLLIFLFSTRPASANWGLDILGTIISTIVSGLGWVLAKLMGVLVYIAQYNDFIRSGAVTNGWIIARDVSNMFFVVILLIIAFATILRVESYSYKKWLPKLILMAVLINFSKTICGLLIDLAQVIMLTFVNAFKDVGAGNLTEMLGIANWQSLEGVEEISKWEVVAAFFLALIYVIISLVTVAAMIGMLVMRIIMIWVYVVLSPFAYLLSAFPGGQKYASQWWSEFTKNLIVGPVLAFFIWLSFASLSNMSSTAGSTGLGSNLQDNNAGNTAGGGGDITDTQAGKFGTSDTLVKFIVSIAMLIGGMKIASEIGGEAGSIAGKGLSKVKTLGAAGAGAVGGFALARAKWAGNTVKDTAVSGIASSSGVQNMLGSIGGSRIPLLNNLAAKTQVKLNSVDQKHQEKSKKYVDSITDTRVLNRLASETAITPQQKQIREAARNKMGFYTQNNVPVSNLVNMDRDQFSKLNSRALSEIGVQGIDANDNAEFAEYLGGNRAARRAYNEGVITRLMRNGGDPNAAGFVRGVDRNGGVNDDLGFDVTRLNYGHLAGAGPIAMGGGGAPVEMRDIWTHDLRSVRGERLRNTTDTVPQYRYSKTTEKEAVDKSLGQETITKVDESLRESARGSGSLSINEFSRGNSNTVAADFDKLNLNNLDKDGGDDFRNIQGVNTSDVGSIKEIAEKMVAIINQELSTLQSKSNLEPGEQKRVENLENAKARFSSPESIDNLSLVNSSAADYKISDVKKAKVHEELHGLGYADEGEVHSAAKNIVENRKYGSRENRADLDNMMPRSASQRQENDKSEPSESVDDILDDEEKSKIVNPDEMEKLDLSELKESLASFSKQMSQVGNDFSKILSESNMGKSSDMPVSPGLIYLFKKINKSFENNNKSVMSLFSQLGGSEAKTPLELSVIVNNLEEKIK